MKLTSNSSNSSTSTVVVNNRSVAFDSAIHGKVAAKACVGNLFVFENLDGNLNGIDGTTTVVEEGHGRFGSTVSRIRICSSLAERSGAVIFIDLRCKNLTARKDSLFASSQMYFLVLNAVIASSCMDEDSTDISSEAASTVGHLWTCEVDWTVDLSST